MKGPAAPPSDDEGPPQTDPSDPNRYTLTAEERRKLKRYLDRTGLPEKKINAILAIFDAQTNTGNVNYKELTLDASKRVTAGFTEWNHYLNWLGRTWHEAFSSEDKLPDCFDFESKFAFHRYRNRGDFEQPKTLVDFTNQYYQMAGFEHTQP